MANRQEKVDLVQKHASIVTTKNRKLVSGNPFLTTDRRSKSGFSNCIGPLESVGEEEEPQPRLNRARTEAWQNTVSSKLPDDLTLVQGKKLVSRSRTLLSQVAHAEVSQRSANVPEISSQVVEVGAVDHRSVEASPVIIEDANETRLADVVIVGFISLEASPAILTDADKVKVEATASGATSAPAADIEEQVLGCCSTSDASSLDICACPVVRPSVEDGACVVPAVAHGSVAHESSNGKSTSSSFARPSSTHKQLQTRVGVSRVQAVWHRLLGPCGAGLVRLSGNGGRMLAH